MMDMLLGQLVMLKYAHGADYTIVYVTHVDSDTLTGLDRHGREIKNWGSHINRIVADPNERAAYWLSRVNAHDDFGKWEPLSAADALYGFVAWLTTREQVTEMGASKDSAPAVELLRVFCKSNRIGKVSENYPGNFVMPEYVIRPFVDPNQLDVFSVVPEGHGMKQRAESLPPCSICGGEATVNITETMARCAVGGWPSAWIPISEWRKLHCKS